MMIKTVMAPTAAFLLVRALLAVASLCGLPDEKGVGIAVLRRQLTVPHRQVTRPRYPQGSGVVEI